MGLVFRIANRMLRSVGLALTPAKNLLMVYQHDYGAGGYDRYRELQVLHNKRKIERVWADETTLSIIAGYLREHVGEVTSGICHGTRRGFEQAELSRQLGCPVIGTEISDTAEEFP